MKRKIDIHNYARRYQRALEILNGDKEIFEENRKIILKFKDFARDPHHSPAVP